MVEDWELAVRRGVRAMFSVGRRKLLTALFSVREKDC